MRISLYTFLLLFCTQFTSAQNYNLSQVKLDLNEHKKPVYFCFTQKTYNPSFSESDLRTFQSYIRGQLKYNFTFHLENHSKRWEDLAKTQHGIEYVMVCELRMRFGIEASLTLYYQNQTRDLQWEQILSVNYSTNEEKEWIRNVSVNLAKKLALKDRFNIVLNLVKEELEKRDKILDERLQNIIQLQKRVDDLHNKVKILEGGTAPIGSIITSTLSPKQFAQAVSDPINWSPSINKWVLADGRNVVGSDYKKITGRESIPDLRGMFIRGLNEGRNDGKQDPSPNRKVGSYQLDAIRSHVHKTIQMIGDNAVDGVDSTVRHSGEHHNEQRNTGDAGGIESRPRNVAAYFYIRIN